MGIALSKNAVDLGIVTTNGPAMLAFYRDVIGLKLHEDWGTTPSAISNCLDVADATDTQVAIHSDTLNESGFVEDTIAATRGVMPTGTYRILMIDPRTGVAALLGAVIAQ